MPVMMPFTRIIMPLDAQESLPFTDGKAEVCKALKATSSAQDHMASGGQSRLPVRGG